MKTLDYLSYPSCSRNIIVKHTPQGDSHKFWVGVSRSGSFNLNDTLFKGQNWKIVKKKEFNTNPLTFIYIFFLIL